MFITLQHGISKFVIITLIFVLIDKLFSMSTILIILLSTIAILIFNKPKRIAKLYHFPVTGSVSSIHHRQGSDTLEISITTMPLIHAMTMRFIGILESYVLNHSSSKLIYKSGITVEHKPFVNHKIFIDRINDYIQKDCKSYGYMYGGGVTIIRIPNWSTMHNSVYVVENQQVIDGETPILVNPINIHPEIQTYESANQYNDENHVDKQENDISCIADAIDAHTAVSEDILDRKSQHDMMNDE